MVTYNLKEKNGKWQVSDFGTKAGSTIEGIREDEIEPLLDDGGVEAVMTALREKAKKFK